MKTRNKSDCKPSNKKNTIKLIISVTVLICLLTASYGFFLATIDNTNKQNMSVETARLQLEYTDCGTNTQSDCANISKNLKPGESVTKTFKVKNTGTLSTTFSINFAELLNTFTNDELVYTIEDITDEEDITTKRNKGI